MSEARLNWTGVGETFVIATKCPMFLSNQFIQRSMQNICNETVRAIDWIEEVLSTTLHAAMGFKQAFTCKTLVLSAQVNFAVKLFLIISLIASHQTCK